MVPFLDTYNRDNNADVNTKNKVLDFNKFHCFTLGLKFLNFLSFKNTPKSMRTRAFSILKNHRTWANTKADKCLITIIIFLLAHVELKIVGKFNYFLKIKLFYA